MTIAQLFSLNSVRLISDENCWERNHSGTAQSYYSLGITQHKLGNYTSALQSHQRALDIRRKLLGEEHSDTAQSYYSLGITQYNLGHYTSALQSAQRALNIRRKRFGEELSDTADSYLLLGKAQSQLGDFASARQSDQLALAIRRKLKMNTEAKTSILHKCLHKLFGKK